MKRAGGTTIVASAGNALSMLLCINKETTGYLPQCVFHRLVLLQLTRKTRGTFFCVAVFVARDHRAPAPPPVFSCSVLRLAAVPSVPRRGSLTRAAAAWTRATAPISISGSATGALGR